MREYPEDRDFPQGLENEDSPQSIRSVWGDPPPGVGWVGLAANGGGKYTGLIRQDDKIPFVFLGGGMTNQAKYIGPVTLVCEEEVPRGIDLKNIINTFDVEGHVSIYSITGGYIEIRPPNGKAIQCKGYRSIAMNNLDYFELAPWFLEKYSDIFPPEIIPSPIEGYFKLEDSQRGDEIIAVAKLTGKKKEFIGNNKHPETVYTLNIAMVGIRENYIDKEIVPKEHWRFFDRYLYIPDPVKPYLKEPLEENFSYITTLNGPIDDEYLFFKDGTYMKLIPWKLMPNRK